MAEDWRLPARRELLGMRGTSGAWGYHQGDLPSVEPTALAGLGLLGSRPPSDPGGDAAGLRAAADWLVSVQGWDGSLGLAEGQPEPGWTTPYALILWQALGGHAAPCRRAASWLIGQKGKALPRESDP